MTTKTEMLTLEVKRKWWLTIALFLCGLYLLVTGDKQSTNKKIIDWLFENGFDFKVVSDD